MILKPADVILFRGTGPISRAISLAEKLNGNDRPYHQFTHAGIATGLGDTFIEARYRGVRTNRLSRIAPERYEVYSPRMGDDLERKNAVAFAVSCLGQEYGILQAAQIVVDLITAGHFTISEDNHKTCSQLVAQALERMGYIWYRDTPHITPADIAGVMSREEAATLHDGH